MAADQDAAQYVVENVGVAWGLPSLDSTFGAHYVVENVGVAFGLPDLDSTIAAHYVVENVGVPTVLHQEIKYYTYLNIGIYPTPSREIYAYVHLYVIEYILNLAKFWDGNAWVRGLIYNGTTWESPKYWTGSRWSD